MNLALPGGRLELAPDAPALMGILNVGRDSVADTTELSGVEAQVERGLELVRDGAAIVDVGAISGRTDTPALGVEDEIARLVPVVAGLAARGVVVSVDTWRAPVVSAVLDAGAAIVNDVSGLADPAVARLAAAAGAALVVMHTGAPPKERFFPGYDDPVRSVREFLAARLELAAAAGVPPDRLILDPGLDYTKTPQETIAVLRRLPEIVALGPPLLLAVSRKYFIGMLTGRPPLGRLAGTLAAVGFGADAGAAVVRAHDVAAAADYLAVRRALAGTDPPTLVGDAADERLMWIAPKG